MPPAASNGTRNVNSIRADSITYVDLQVQTETALHALSLFNYKLRTSTWFVRLSREQLPQEEPKSLSMRRWVLIRVNAIIEKMKPKVYLETTIISYFTARPSRDIITAAHQQLTQEWWESRKDNFDVFISQIVLQEVNEGDKDAIQRRMEMIESIPEIELNPEAIALAQALVSDGLVPEKAAADALHIAIATVQGMDYLLTWNLKHLANAVIRNAIADACRGRGYEPPVICTPEELMEV